MYPPNYWKKQEGHWFGSKYLLKEFLGCGAYGAVFRADEMLAERVMQSVAIKIVIADMDNLDNQLAELQLSVRLRHPHLINGITCEQGEIFGDLCLGLVMELADDTLEGYYAKRSQVLSVETVTTIAQHLAAGLKALHEDSITHRDLKPANVLLVKDQWKLGDFGIARSLQDKTSTYTNASQQIGTVAYMPPEAYSGKISPAWDVWALGVIIHQLLTGQHPFPTQLAPELIQMVLMEKPQIDPKLPLPLQEIVTGCLIKDSQQRWSAKQVLVALNPSTLQTKTSPRQVIQYPKVDPKYRQERVSQIPKFPRRALETIREALSEKLSLELIQLPGGQFMMGASSNDSKAYRNEKPQRIVTLESFAIGKYPITQEQYEAIMGGNPSYFLGNPNNPVERVSWNDAQEFCKKLSQATGKKYRLPSEAEWEYACRAGTTTCYYFGNDEEKLESYAWFGDNSEGKTHQVATKKANMWGIYDMHGNVWEWCEDEWHDNYKGAPEDAASWIQNNSARAVGIPAYFISAQLQTTQEKERKRVMRGGSWAFNSRNCRSSCRDKNLVKYEDYDIGFRVVTLL